MTEEKLRNALKEAEEKGKIGLLIWSCRRIWDNHAKDMIPGCTYYDTSLSQIQAGEETTIYVNCHGFTTPGILAVPVEKLLSSDNFFKHVLSVCETDHYDGPITLVPITEENNLS